MGHQLRIDRSLSEIWSANTEHHFFSWRTYFIDEIPKHKFVSLDYHMAKYSASNWLSKVWIVSYCSPVVSLLFRNIAISGDQWPTLMANPYQRAIFVLQQISKTILFEQWQKINKMFKTMFKSIFKFRICSYFMYLKVLVENNVKLYFWKFSQIKNRTLVRIAHYILYIIHWWISTGIALVVKHRITTCTTYGAKSL